MRKLIVNSLLIIVNCFLFLLLPITNYQLSIVSAHVLKSDGNIGAILHIDPDDDPIANQVAYFFFEFKDKQNKFQPADCSCTFSILEGGKEIYAQPLFQNNPSPSLTNSSVIYTFPQKDVYQVKVEGTPNTPGEFQPFTLIYDVRVDKTADAATSSNNSSSSNYVVYLIAGVLVILGFGGAMFFRRKK